MAEGTDRVAQPERLRLEARCAWCGVIPLGLDRIAVHGRAGAEGLFEFLCPSCGRLNLRRLDRADLRTLSSVGIAAGDGPAPFELLEPRTGPPIAWDDLIDFHEAISRLERFEPGAAETSDQRTIQGRHAA